MASKKNKKRTPVVSVLNMKGGVGKTTISANLFRAIFKLNKINTLLVDIDPQFNLTQLLMKREDYDTILEKQQTIHSIFQHESPDSVFAVSEEYNLKLPEISSLMTNLDIVIKDNENRKLDLMAGNFQLATLNLKGNNELRIPRKRFKNFIEQAKQEYQLIIIDCNPSTSFLTKCALEVSTNILIPVKPDKFSKLGVEMISEFITIFLGGGLEPKQHILLNDIIHSKGEQTKIIREIRSSDEFGQLVLVNELKHSEYLQAKQDYTGFGVDQGGPWSTHLESLLNDIAKEYSKTLGV